MAFKSARCPNCSGDLSLDPAMDKGCCMHCGSEVIVEEAIKKVKVDGVASAENLITMADNARESDDYREAYDYYKKALEVDPLNIESMLNRALMAGMLARVDNSRIDEFININNVINKAPEEEKESLKIKASSGIKDVVTHLLSFISLDQALPANKTRLENLFENPINYENLKGDGYLELARMKDSFIIKIIKALDMASEYDPRNRESVLSLKDKWEVIKKDDQKRKQQILYKIGFVMVLFVIIGLIASC